MLTFNAYLIERSIDSKIHYLADLLAEHGISLTKIVQETMDLSEIFRFLKQNFQKGFQRGYDPQRHFQQYQKQAFDALQQLKAHFKGYEGSEFPKWVDQAIAYLKSIQPPATIQGQSHGQQQQHLQGSEELHGVEPETKSFPRPVHWMARKMSQAPQEKQHKDVHDVELPYDIM